MGLPLYLVDAFTAEAFRGNAAAVVLGHGEDAWMQRVAAEMKHSETAFLRPRDDGGHDLRWFTPEVEVDLCGHATLASAHVLWETARAEHATFHTRSGALPSTHNGDGTITLDFPVAEPVPEEPIPELFDALGIDPIDFLRTDGDFFLCVVGQADTVRKLAPDFGRLRGLAGVRGVYVSAPGDQGYDIVSRCFAPRVGIDEDPVTGSMHCVLVAYWGPRLGKDELHAYQASDRGGELTVVRAGDRALLTGRAATVLRGELVA
jgi:PhzF family phenazine biosynthesis protein